MGKSRRKSDRCTMCGEKHPLKTITLSVDGKKMGGWRLCRPCLATTLVAIVSPLR